jgi:hypothetical protein
VKASSTADAAFLAMVKSRSPYAVTSRQGVASLKAVELTLPTRKFDAGCVEPLRPLVAAGMRISVSDKAGRVISWAE